MATALDSEREEWADSPGRRPGRKSDRTRRRILTAAKQLFDRRGYRDTTIDDITHRAKIAHGTFYLYFRGKGQLLKELLEQTFEEFDRLAGGELLDEGHLPELVRETLLTYHRNRLLMRLLREASASDLYFREHYDELFLQPLVSRLQERIAEVHQLLPEGAERLDPRATARAIVGMIESFAYGMFVGGEDYSMELAVDTLSRFCARAMGLTARSV
jgi:AcrR family transcriptional regulator